MSDFIRDATSGFVTFVYPDNTSSTLKVSFGGKITPPVFTKIGYKIKWYSDTSLTEEWNFDTDAISGKNITLYGKMVLDDSFTLGTVSPGGGQIFFVSSEGFTMTDTGEICHYLEAAPAQDWPVRVNWASDNYTSTEIPGTSRDLGTGRKNTALILVKDTNAPAALACRNYENNGYSDWFLPSYEELRLLRDNSSYVDNMTEEKDPDGIGISVGYWSSTQADYSEYYYWHTAWSFYFEGSGISVAGYKNSSRYVRPIRAF